jgi:4-hydroxy-3-polyprenylbenzoate decarboxylase
MNCVSNKNHEKDMKIVVGITGASGAIYARTLIENLKLYLSQIADVGVIISDTGKQVWEYELEESWENIPFKIYEKKDFYAPFASGSSQYDALIICPCSMGSLGRIANGTSDDLLTRTADVMLKERRKLILVTRETPLNLIHINNMKTITEAGGIILPASPSFYSKPKTINDAVMTVVERVLSLAGIETAGKNKWGE